CEPRVRQSGHDSTVMLTTSAYGIAATAVSATRLATTSKGSSAANRSRSPSTASAVVTSLANGAYNSALMIGALQACDYRCDGHTVASSYPSKPIGVAHRGCPPIRRPNALNVPDHRPDETCRAAEASR